MTISLERQIIKNLDVGRKQSDLAKEFNIERNSVTRLKRKENEIISIAESYKVLDRSETQRKTEGALLEKFLIIWFKQSRSKNILIYRSNFTLKDHSIAKKL